MARIVKRSAPTESFLPESTEGCVKYKKYSPRKKGRFLIDEVNKLIEQQYGIEGHYLTVRQIFYQFVVKGLLQNKDSEYRRIDRFIGLGRDGGLISWDAIVDRRRNLQGNVHWDNPSDMLRYYASYFEIDKWSTQHCRLEVWIEKEALVGVIARVCEELDVPYFACIGFDSKSEIRSAAQRFLDWNDNGQRVVVLHLADHDQSGYFMTEYIEERLHLYRATEVEVKRLALNMDQIEEFNLPPNPVKEKDPRTPRYREELGISDCWELDALRSAYIVDLIRDNILALRDEERWDIQVRKEEEYIEELERYVQAAEDES